MEPYQKLAKKFLEALQPLGDCKLLKRLYSTPEYGYEKICIYFDNYLDELSININITNTLYISISIHNPRSIDVSELELKLAKIIQSNIYTFVEESYPMVYEFADAIREFILSHPIYTQPNKISLENYSNPLPEDFLHGFTTHAPDDNKEKVKKFLSSISEEDKDKILEGIYLATIDILGNVHCNDPTYDKKE